MIATGRASPLGATWSEDGVNFSLFSRHAAGVTLPFFDTVDDPRPSRIIRLDPAVNRTYFYWHVFVPGERLGQLYGYRADGPFHPHSGMRFDPSKVLLDPYGRGVMVPAGYAREAAALRVHDRVRDARPGFTRHPSSGVADKRGGTFAGLIEKILYLRDLGVTAMSGNPLMSSRRSEAARGPSSGRSGRCRPR